MEQVHQYARDWIAIARATRAEAFASLHPGPFLLGKEVPDVEYAFETRAVAVGPELQSVLRELARETVRRDTAEGTAEPDPDWSAPVPAAPPADRSSRRWVIPVRKKDGAPAQHRIFVGRDTGNDIWIPHPTVSKLQGYFVRPASDADQTWQFLDADSANGTRWNGKSIPARAACRMRDGDVLAFGQCEFTWLSATRLHENLLAMAPARPQNR